MRTTLEEFDEIRKYAFDAMGVDSQTEIHAKYIYHGKAEFKGKELELRLQLLSHLLKLLEHEDVHLVYAAIKVEKLFSADDALKHAFMHFVERAHNTVEKGGTGLLIGDLDSETRNRLWSDFSDYRRRGTPWAYGKELPRFPDTVHFVDSRVCELVQLADVYAFYISGAHRTGYAAKRLNELAKGINLFPKSYKNWPN